MPTLEDFRNGGEGMTLWCEENVYAKIYLPGSDVSTWWPMGDLPKKPNPDTGRSYHYMWEMQKEILHEALVMRNGRFKHRLIVFCWQRGEGKSYLACLTQLWKFFCWPAQQIMLGANSKDQVKFVHYDIMRDLIINSPNLKRIVGEKNIQEKEIRLTSKKRVVSIIRSISSFSGIVSNITGYTFSEIFDMKNPKFFVQLDGSIRNMPNALGAIDSTVSDKSHVLYRLYNTWREDKDPTLYFSYRFSKKGSYKDYYHPFMSKNQLESYKSKFPPAEFARYFKNTWEAGSTQVFTNDIIEAMLYIGLDGVYTLGEEVRTVIANRHKIEETLEEKVQRMDKDTFRVEHQIEKSLRRLTSIETIYQMKDSYNRPIITPVSALEELTRIFETDWSILVGVDRSDPMKVNKGLGARTMISVIAKGLPFSKDNVEMFSKEGASHKYIYFLLHIAHASTSSLEEIKEVLKEVSEEYDGIDALCSERWGMWDLVGWCEEQNIYFDAVTGTYTVQRAMFTEFYNACRSCRFKAPRCYVEGSKSGDIFREEMGLFDHNIDKKWYGSPEKSENYGVQDDCMYATGYAIYAGREIGVLDFRERKGLHHFGEMYQNKALVGRY